MELADVTDSKSVGSNTVRVRPPPSAPKSVTPLNEWGYTFYVLVGGRTRILRVVHGCTIAVEQSRCTMQRPKRPHFDTPRHISLSQTGISLLFLVPGGRTRTVRVVQGCTIAVAQSRYARMHKDSHTKPLHDATAQMAVDAQMQRPKRPQTQGCVIVLAQSFARCETNRASTIRQPRPATLSPAH